MVSPLSQEALKQNADISFHHLHSLGFREGLSYLKEFIEFCSFSFLLCSNYIIKFLCINKQMLFQGKKKKNLVLNTEETNSTVLRVGRKQTWWSHCCISRKDESCSLLKFWGAGGKLDINDAVFLFNKDQSLKFLLKWKGGEHLEIGPSQENFPKMFCKICI